jgi:hypothetical protein
MKNLFLTLLFLACPYMVQAQNDLTLLDEAQTPYKVAGKFVAEIKSSDGLSKFFLEYKEKEKTFKITEVFFDAQNALTGITMVSMPLKAMNFQTDGYGSRVEMSENQYYGTGEFAQLTLLCQNQQNCFTQETINVSVPTDVTKRQESYATYYFSKKEVAESVLKEITSKK